MSKMSIEKKNKLLYSVELIAFSVVFLILGILELLKVIRLSDTFQLIFKIVTLIGASWLVFDLAWSLLSEKRKAKSAMIDKWMMLPLAIYLYGFDIGGFAVTRPYEYYQIGVPIVFFYIACTYLFQGIYHYYKPIPLILEAIKEEEEELRKQSEPAQEEPIQEEQKEEIEKDD